MPEFILNKSRKSHPFYDLSEFAKGYVEAMFFTNGDTADDNENLLNELGTERLTRASVKTIGDDCRRFLESTMPGGKSVREWIECLQELGAGRYGDGVTDDTRAGHMFWYARQGHGVGWSDDYSSDESAYKIAEKLQEACRAFGECDEIYVQRGWIHVC